MKLLGVDNSFIAAIAISILFTDCSKESNPTGPSDRYPVLEVRDYSKVVLTMSDFDTIRVGHQLGLDLKTPNIVRIGFGTKVSGSYAESLAVPTSYDPNAHTNFVHFDFSVHLRPSRAIMPFTIRYYLVDSTVVDVDKTISAYKYPYSSAEIVLSFPSLEPPLNGLSAQDVDRVNSSVFFHPFGGAGLFRYDMTTQRITELLFYGGGDYIAADSDYVFCDWYHFQIHRFNLHTNTVDLVFPRTFTDIWGMDVYNGVLYVLEGLAGLKVLSRDGTLIDSIHYTGYGITIVDSVIYSASEFYRFIDRFDMRTGRNLQKVLAPTYEINGIKEHNGMLYYYDIDQQIIGRVPIGNLTEAI